MMLFLKAYPFVLAAIVLLDLLWLGLVMKDFYRAQLGHLLAPGVVWAAAILFYLVFAAGVAYFATLPGLAAGSLLRAALLGAALGILCYATYDLTNHATMKGWPLAVTLLDIAWGAVITGAAAAAGYWGAKLLG